MGWPSFERLRQMNTELLRALRAKLVLQLAAVDTLLSEDIAVSQSAETPSFIKKAKRLQDGKTMRVFVTKFIGETIKTNREIFAEIQEKTGRDAQTAQRTGSSFLSRNNDLFFSKGNGRWGLTPKGIAIFRRMK